MEKRVALVIGNGNYTEAGFLKNPANDAVAISAALSGLGFEVIGGHSGGIDLEYGAFAARLRDFGRALREASVALFFYAGHGLQVGGRNYLVPVDAALEQEADVGTELVELQIVLNQMERPQRTSIVILDACRNNPLARNLARAMGLDGPRAAGITEGLTEQRVVAGTLIAFATQPGHVAYDGAGENGYFTEALLEQLRHDAARDAELLFRAVRARVVNETKGKLQGAQVPWTHSSLIGAFSFAAPKAQEPQVAPTAGVTGAQPTSHLLSIAAAEWAQIKGTTDLGRLQRFEQHFAGTYYAEEARAQRRFLEAEAERRERERVQVAARAQAEAERVARQEEEDIRAGRIVRVMVGLGGGRDEARLIKPGSGESFQDAPFAPEMVVLPAAEFLMGTAASETEALVKEYGKALEQYFRRENPQHRVAILKPFAIGRHAITRGQFAAFVNATGHKMEGGANVWDGKEWKLDASKSWRDPGFAQGDDHPVVCVSHDDAQAYAKWLTEKTGKGYRLPSEAEWEYACRAGTTTPFWWGSSISTEQANYDGNYVFGGGKKGEYRQKTVPVQSFQPNLWGLYQVHGNVWEWCEDALHDTYEGAPTDGAAWINEDGRLRVLRGGSWNNDPRSLRAAIRYGNTTDGRDYDSGFRLART